MMRPLRTLMLIVALATVAVSGQRGKGNSGGGGGGGGNGGGNGGGGGNTRPTLAPEVGRPTITTPRPTFPPFVSTPRPTLPPVATRPTLPPELLANGNGQPTVDQNPGDQGRPTIEGKGKGGDGGRPTVDDSTTGSGRPTVDPTEDPFAGKGKGKGATTTDSDTTEVARPTVDPFSGKGKGQAAVTDADPTDAATATGKGKGAATTDGDAEPTESAAGKGKGKGAATTDDETDETEETTGNGKGKGQGGPPEGKGRPDTETIGNNGNGEGQGPPEGKGKGNPLTREFERVKPTKRGKPDKPVAEHSEKALNMTSDNVGIKFNANNAKVTLYHAESSGDSNSTDEVAAPAEGKKAYSIAFAHMFQTAGTTEPPFEGRLRSVNLNGAYDWTITTPQTTSNDATWETNFNMVSVRAAGSPNKPHPQIEFHNHVLVDESGTVIKFDIVIDEFEDEWWHPDATHLVVAYRVTESGEGGEEETPTGEFTTVEDATISLPANPADGEPAGEQQVTADVVVMDGARFSAVDTALTDGNQTEVEVTLSTGTEPAEGDEASEDRFIYIAYERFNSSVIHDPTLDLVAPVPVDETTDFEPAGPAQEVSGTAAAAAPATLLAALLASLALRVAA